MGRARPTLFGSDGAHAALARTLAEDGTRHHAALEERLQLHALPPLPLLPAPVLLDVHMRSAIATAAEELIALLARALDARLARDDDTLLTRHLEVPHALTALIAHEPAQTRLSCARLDGLVDEESGTLRFIEIQAGDPSGLGWTDFALDVWARSGLTDALGARADALLPARRQVLSSVTSTTNGPRVAHVCPRASFVHSDHACMVALAREAGRDTLLVDPSALTWTGDKLLVDGDAVDAVVRDTHEELVGPHAVEGEQACVDACLHGLAHQNAFADAILDDKGSFALLFDADFRRALFAGERGRVDASVQETHLASAERCEVAHREPAAWVLKPRLGYGGFGVVVGDDDPEAFRRALADARAETHVLQRYLSTTMQPTFVREGAHVLRAPRFLTFSAWVIGRRFAGCFARAGEGRVVNVHQGGGIAPVLFV
jgi:hypothetical protein